MTTEVLPDFLTPDEAAAMLHRPVRTLQYWRYRRTGPRFYTVQHRVYYDRADLAAWVADQRRESAR
jgi:hypothetical protein